MKMGNFYKGIVAGLAVGAASAFAASKIQPKHINAAKRAVTKAAKNIGESVSDFNPMH